MARCASTGPGDTRASALSTIAMARSPLAWVSKRQAPVFQRSRSCWTRASGLGKSMRPSGGLHSLLARWYCGPSCGESDSAAGAALGRAVRDGLDAVHAQVFGQPAAGLGAGIARGRDRPRMEGLRGDGGRHHRQHPGSVGRQLGERMRQLSVRLSIAEEVITPGYQAIRPPTPPTPPATAPKTAPPTPPPPAHPANARPG